MTKINFFSLLLTVLGLSLFLYGSAFYDPPTGWIGVFFLLCGILTFFFLYIYGELLSKKSD